MRATIFFYFDKFKSLSLSGIIIPAFLISLISCSVFSTNHKKADEKNDILIIGEVTWSDWKKNAGWETYSAGKYKPDQQKAVLLKKLVDSSNINFMVFGGSWCSDTKSELPKIFELIKVSEIPLSRVRLIGVLRDKTEPSGIAAGYHIEKVASLIVLKDGKEIGRVEEYPQKGSSWEDEIIGIIKK